MVSSCYSFDETCFKDLFLLHGSHVTLQLIRISDDDISRMSMTFEFLRLVSFRCLSI